MLLIGNGRLITRDLDNPYLEDGGVLIKDNKIVAVGKTDKIKKEYPEASFMDAKGRLIMPGLINAHQHFYSTLMRGLANDSPPAKNFVEILEGTWWRLDQALDMEDVYYSAAIPLIEGIKNGVTTVFDHHASPNALEGSLAMIEQAGKDTGVRLSTCYEVSDRYGQDSVDASIKENMEAIEAGKRDETDMFKGMFGLHASMTISDTTMEKCLSAMAGEEAGFHVHIAEGMADVEDSIKKYGKRVVERWHDYGILNERALAIHCIHLNDREFDILRDTGAWVINNPESNMGNAVGTSPVIKLKAHGINLGLGTDGYTFDMFESWKVGNIIQKHANENPNVGWGEFPEMLFQGNADMVNTHFDGKTGRLKEGYYADIILLDYNPITPMDASNIESHLLFGAQGRMVDTTIINGKIIMKDRVLIGIDEQSIYAKSREQARKVRERF